MFSKQDFTSKSSLKAFLTVVICFAILWLGHSIFKVYQVSQLTKLDVVKAADARVFDSTVVAYYKSNGALPSTLADSADGVVYKKTSVSTYNICATFNTASRVPTTNVKPRAYEDDFWSSYTAGYFCFPRAIQMPKK